jgi:hypothetical protein
LTLRRKTPGGLLALTWRFLDKRAAGRYLLFRIMLRIAIELRLSLASLLLRGAEESLLVRQPEVS